jgi:hypothetical protein
MHRPIENDREMIDVSRSRGSFTFVELNQMCFSLSIFIRLLHSVASLFQPSGPGIKPQIVTSSMIQMVEDKNCPVLDASASVSMGCMVIDASIQVHAILPRTKLRVISRPASQQAERGGVLRPTDRQTSPQKSIWTVV